uniref:Putative structural protein n=1 Tax=Motacilla cinerea parvoviridae sp. TaxID=2794518 RepID=A0A8A4XCH0_9VIRU|nr:MAG: putative structural protein [Motacilla cinerea parvoviridae sp.]
MPRALGPPPYERPNWERMNEGQRRYAMEQWQLARVRRGLNIDHPIPEVYQPEVEPVSSPEPTPSPHISPVESIPHNFYDVSFDEDELFGSIPDQSPLFSSGGTPFRASVPDIPDSEDDYPPDAQPVPNMSQSSGTPMETQSQGRPNPDSTQDAGSARKFQKTGRNRLPGTAGGQGSGGGEASPGLVGRIPRPIQGTHVSTRYFKKVHRFLTFGLAYKPISVTTGTAPNVQTDVFMVTPLAKIPWEYLFMYMNKSEFSLMPWGANVEKIKCTVRSENVRIAFPTNSSSSELATLNQNKFLRVAKGLAQNVNGLDVKPKTFSDTQPMIVTDITPISKDDDLKEMEESMYGIDPNAIGFTTQTPVHQFGIPYALPYYYSVTNQQDANKGGWPCLQSYIEEFEADGASGQNICVMEYEPKCGLIKSMQPAIYSGFPSDKTADLTVNIGTGVGTSKPRSTALTVDKTGGTWKTLNEANYSSVPSTVDEADNDTVELVEKCQYIHPGLFPGNFIPSSCPTLHVGLQPVPALTSKVIGNDAALNSYTDSQAYFEVTCEAWVKCSYPTERPLYKASNIKLSDMLWTSAEAGKDLNIGKTMVHGLYQK